MKVAVIGDSVNIDTYPNLDAKERFGSEANQGLGAGSLLYENDDNLFPEFEDRDLNSQCPEDALHFYNMGTDGGTMTSIPKQIAKIRNPQDLDWLFVTIGGNDLLMTFSGGRASTKELNELMGDYSDMVNMLLAHFPRAQIVLNTVYDPTDGTGILELKQREPLPIGFLTVFNNFIKQQAGRNGRVSVVDVWKHFLGQGITAMMREDGSMDPNQGYYWASSIIEPNIYGASKLRELWLEAMGIQPGKLWQPNLQGIKS